MKTKNKVSNMTRKQFEKVPLKEWDKTIKFYAMVLLPEKEIHDSGYGMISVILVDNRDNPICRTNGCSDVICLNGIAGFRYPKDRENLRCAWSIDLLPKSGLFRIWDSTNETCSLECGPCLSSLEIFSKR
jgi:hypothetical protein